MKKTILIVSCLLLSLFFFGNDFLNLQIIGNIPDGAYASIIVRNEEKLTKGFGNFDAIFMIQRIYLYQNGETKIFDGIEIKAGAYSVRLSYEDLGNWILSFDEIIKYTKTTKLPSGYFRLGNYFFLIQEERIKEIVFDNNVTRVLSPEIDFLEILKAKKRWMDINK